MSIHRFLLPFERWQLAGVWFLSGFSDSIDSEAKKLIEANPALKSEVLLMLKEAQEANTNSQSALYFASLFPNDPDVKQRLRLLANSRANIHIKCQSLELLKHTHKVTIYSADDPSASAQVYTMTGNYECDAH